MPKPLDDSATIPLGETFWISSNSLKPGVGGLAKDLHGNLVTKEEAAREIKAIMEQLERDGILSKPLQR